MALQAPSSQLGGDRALPASSARSCMYPIVRYLPLPQLLVADVGDDGVDVRVVVVAGVPVDHVLYAGALGIVGVHVAVVVMCVGGGLVGARTDTGTACS